MVLYLEPSQPRSVGVRGRETSAFEMVLSPEAKQKQAYGSFEMVSPPQKQLYYK